MSVSLSMIVRNGESTLRAAIESALPWVNEVVIVDTGSMDSSGNIAQSLGAQVHTVQWRGFSEARNQCLDRCSGDWILVLDADEVVDYEFGRNIPRLVDSKETWAYRVYQKTILPDFSSVSIPMVRLFRRHENLRFEGVLHERVQCRHPEFFQVNTKYLIHHHGGESLVDPNHPKTRFYEEILTKQLSQVPDDVRSLYHLAILFKRRGQNEHVIRLLMQALDCNHLDMDIMPLVFDAMASSMYDLGRFRDAEFHCRRGLELDPEYPSLIYHLGLCAWRQKRFKQARILARQAMFLSQTYMGPFPFDDRIGSTLAPALQDVSHSSKKHLLSPRSTNLARKGALT